ncbi:MAG TPA: hypothetical protein VJ818_05485 [Actinomycetota bacterium]|nr:hypothetical protein [Actinomycetota bacterium]
MTDVREYDDMQRDTRDRERMEMSSNPDRSDDDAQNLNPDYHPDRMDMRAKDDMRSTDDVDDTDPESRRLSDVDPMGGGHVRGDRSARDDMRARNDMRDTNDVRSDEMPDTRRGIAPADTRGRATQMEMWPDMGDLRQRFDAIQSEFIDDPRSAVRKAEDLMNDVINRITSSMRDRMASMHKDADKNADTEQLRQTMRGYRDLVDWMETRRAA